MQENLRSSWQINSSCRHLEVWLQIANNCLPFSWLRTAYSERSEAVFRLGVDSPTFVDMKGWF